MNEETVLAKQPMYKEPNILMNLWYKIKYYFINRFRKSNALSHAERELNILFKSTPDTVIKEFSSEILALVNKFGKSGQSGGSAPYVSSAISNAVKKLCMFEPICPITGIEDEWNEITELDPSRGKCFQNNRLSSIFKNENQKPYYLNAIVFQGEEKYDTFTGTIEDISSRQYIKEFPFTPKTFYIDVIRELYDKEKHGENPTDLISCKTGDMLYKLKDRNQLKEVFEYYDRFEEVK